jgi:hypothetical protein
MQKKKGFRKTGNPISKLKNKVLGKKEGPAVSRSGQGKVIRSG